MQIVKRLRRLAKRGVYGISDQLFRLAGLFCVRVDAPCLGFFAFVGGMVPMFDYWRRAGLKPYLVFSSTQYLSPERGPNFLEYFFEGPSYSRWQRLAIKWLPIRTVGDWAQAPHWVRNNHPSVADGFSMFSQYFRVRQEILDDVEILARKYIVKDRTLGVHFRGTDKWTESTHLSFEETLRLIDLCLMAHPELTHIFVSTDNEAYCDFIRQNIHRCTVSYHADHLRSTDGGAVHLSPEGDPYLKGYEALVNCLLLSRCTVLLKSLSNLSAWAKIFSPSMPMYLMNRPAGPGIQWLGFPELEMVERGWFAENLSREGLT